MTSVSACRIAVVSGPISFQFGWGLGKDSEGSIASVSGSAVYRSRAISLVWILPLVLNHKIFLRYGKKAHSASTDEPGTEWTLGTH